MKLLTTLRSPFGRKVKIMAIEKGLENSLEIIVENLQEKSDLLVKSNPLTQVPTLILDNGECIFDSPVVAEYIDSLNDSPKLIPTNFNERINVLKVSAIADGMTEQAIAVFFENAKAENLRDQAKIKKAHGILENCFKYLEAEKSLTSEKLNMAQIAVASALGYINFRLADLGWQAKYPNVAKFFEEFSKRDSMKKTEPRV
jgi:glutathione S-transferase